MSEKTKELLKELVLHNTDFLVANLDKINFGEKDFVIKMGIRFFVRKLQTFLKNKNLDFKEFFKGLGLVK
jgi:hypothetical protein